LSFGAQENKKTPSHQQKESKSTAYLCHESDDATMLPQVIEFDSQQDQLSNINSHSGLTPT